MINKIITLLKDNHEVHDYEVSVTNTKSSQLFYVLDKLETNRITNNKDIKVVVYHDFDEYRGSSNFVVNAADDEETIKNKITLAIDTAKKVKNPKFALVSKSNEELIKVESIKETNLNEVALKCADAVMKANHYQDGWINSVEIFVTKVEHHFLNSKDVDLSYEKTSIEIEIIPTWKGKDEEIELYLDFVMIDNNYEEITQRTSEILNEAKLRSEAVTLSEEMKNVPVLMSGDMLKMLMWNFAEDVSYYNVFTKGNHYQKGDKIADMNIDFTLLPYYKGVANSIPFDGSGIILKEFNIVKDGEIKQYWGDSRFGQYLKEDNISGNINILKLDVKEERIAKPLPSIEMLNFSSPQLDSSSGYFGGEVRLAIYRDQEGNVTPLSGFSVSGNIYEAIKTAQYTNEDCVLKSYVGPKAIIFKDLNIN